MMLDLPTACPPRKTIFILVLPVIVLIEWFIAIQIFWIIITTENLKFYFRNGTPDGRKE